MKLTLKRHTFTPTTTIGDLTADGIFVCHILEDTDRGLDDGMTLEQVAAIKVYGKTAIPYGQYEVVLSYSNRFRRLLPLLNPVKGFTGIRIHPGNKASDTEGCLLPGMTIKTDTVLSSRIAFGKLFKIIQTAIKKEKVLIEIIK